MGLGVLAHQGGWDEALLVAGPLLLFAGIVWNAKRRAVKQGQTSTDADERDVRSDEDYDSPRISVDADE